MAEALKIDGDDLNFDLLPAIERSFAVDLPDDSLRHVVMARELHDLIREHVSYSGGDRCGTSHVFHRLRRALRDFGVPENAHPAYPLANVALTPKALRTSLAAQTGLDMPPSVMGTTATAGCMVALATGALSAWLIGWGAIFLAPAMVFAALRLDRGSWRAEWRTLGDLTRAVAALNYAQLANAGAREVPSASWRALRDLIAGTSAARAEDIEPSSRLMA